MNTTSTSNSYTYYAFISYSHRDEQWAKWIQKALESYRLPSTIERAHGNVFPKRLHPIFRDASDLGTGKLVESLHLSLEASRYLIVICSPNSANPNAEGINYVDEEIRCFTSLGRENQIIPVIINGTSCEAFPPQIRQLGLVALDATKAPRRRILNDIVAKILNLRPDELWNRAERRRRRNIFLNGIAAFFVFVFALLFGLYQYDIRKEHTEYYADYVEHYSVPAGIFPLAEEATKTRPAHYRFIYRGRNGFLGERLLREVYLSNSAGRATVHSHSEHLERPSIQRLNYDERNRVTGIRILSKQGKELFQKQFSGKNNVCIDFSKSTADEVITAFALAKNTLDAIQSEAPDAVGRESYINTKSRIGRHRLIYDEHGWRERIFYKFRGFEDPASDANGIFGLEVKNDELGRPKELYYLDRNGAYHATNTGMAGKRYSYDLDGNLCLVECVDLQGNLVENEKLWAVCKLSFEKGCCTDLRFENRERKPVLSNDGYAYAKFTYDSYGNRTKEEWFETDKKNRASKGFFRNAGFERTYDSFGNVTTQTDFDENWEPGFKWQYSYDFYGNVTSVNGYYGKMMFLGKIELKYDSCGNIVSQRQHILNSSERTEGWYYKYTYDTHGNRTRSECFELDEKTRCIEGESAGWEHEYDSFGNVVSRTFFDASWSPARAKFLGYAHAKLYYDSRGNQTKEEFFDIDKKTRIAIKTSLSLPFFSSLWDNPKATKDRESELAPGEYAAWEREYDICGNIISETYFDTSYNPVLTQEGYAHARYAYDSRGNRTKAEFYGVDKKTRILLIRWGYHGKYAGWEKEYDSLGNVVKTTYFDTQWKPVAP